MEVAPRRAPDEHLGVEPVQPARAVVVARPLQRFAVRRGVGHEHRQLAPGHPDGVAERGRLGGVRLPARHGDDQLGDLAGERVRRPEVAHGGAARCLRERRRLRPSLALLLHQCERGVEHVVGPEPLPDAGGDDAAAPGVTVDPCVSVTGEAQEQVVRRPALHRARVVLVRCRLEPGQHRAELGEVTLDHVDRRGPRHRAVRVSAEQQGHRLGLQRQRRHLLQVGVAGERTLDRVGPVDGGRFDHLPVVEGEDQPRHCQAGDEQPGQAQQHHDVPPSRHGQSMVPSGRSGKASSPNRDGGAVGSAGDLTAPWSPGHPVTRSPGQRHPDSVVPGGRRPIHWLPGPPAPSSLHRRWACTIGSGSGISRPSSRISVRKGGTRSPSRA